jgi:hypothetical protein
MIIPESPKLGDALEQAFERHIQRQNPGSMEAFGFSPEEIERIELAATEESMDPKDFVAKATMATVEMVLLNSAGFLVDASTFDQFMRLAQKSPQDLPAVMELIEKHKRAVGIVTTDRGENPMPDMTFNSQVP